MKNDNKSDYTIEATSKLLTRISKHENLNEPEEVKHWIAQLPTRDGYKRALCCAYDRYCNFYQIKWTKPKYFQDAQNVALPTKEKLNMLIAKARSKLSIKLSISMETGIRPIELCTLRVKDIDIEHKTINPLTAKKGNPPNNTNNPTTSNKHT